MIKKPLQYGFTLVELMVYMIITSIVATVAATAWYNSATFTIDTKAKMRGSGDLNELLVYLEEDISRMGAGADFAGGSLTEYPTTIAANGGDATDFSSFEFVDDASNATCGQDSLAFYALVYDSLGNATHYERISYGMKVGLAEGIGSAFRNDTLIRYTRSYSLDGTKMTGSTDTTETIMVDHLTCFNIRLGTYETGTALFTPPDPLTAGWLTPGGTNAVAATNSGSKVRFSGFISAQESLWDLNDSEGGSVNEFSLEKGHTYRVNFTSSNSDTLFSEFNYAADTLRVRVIDGTSGALISNVPSYLFYPTPSGSSANRSFTFSPAVDVDDATLRFEVKLADAVGTSNEWLEIEDLSFTELNEGAYTWVPSASTTTVTTAHKMATEAIRINLVSSYKTYGVNKATNAVKYKDNYSQTEKTFMVPNNNPD